MRPGAVAALAFGLVLAAFFAAASSLELSSVRADAVLRAAPVIIALLAALVVGWAVVSLAELPPLSAKTPADQLARALAVARDPGAPAAFD